MTIAFDAKRAFQNRTGLGNYSRFLIESLLYHFPENNYRAYTPKKKIDFSPEGLRIAFPQNKFYRIFHALWRSRGIVPQLRSDGVEVFHGLSNELPDGLAQAGIKSVVTIHDLIFERFPQFYAPIDRVIYHRKFRVACQQADHIVAVSEQTKRDIMDFYSIGNDKISVVYQDCDATFKEPVSEPTKQEILQRYGIKQPFVLCVATMSERKNQLTLVQAFHRLGTSNLNLVLVGGKGTYQKRIEKYIRENHLQDQVSILNYVPLADLPALYQSAAVVAYPSLFEGFGIPIIEALHAGVPVLAATGSCLEEAGGNGAVYVAPTDVATMAEKLAQLLHNESLRNELIQAGKEHVQQFDATLISQQMVAIYDKILGKTALGNQKRDNKPK